MAPRSRRSIIGSAVLICGFAVGGGGALLRRFRYRHDDRFLPGAMVNGRDVSGLTPAEAAGSFDSRWGAYLANPIIFHAPDRDWRPSAADIGIKVDYLSPLRNAYLWGRKGGVLQRIWEQWNWSGTQRNWPVEYGFNRRKLREYLQSVASTYFQPFNNAEVAFDGDRLQFRGAQSGLELDWESVMSLVEHPGPEATVQELEIALVQTTPKFSTDAARDLASSLESMISTPLVLAFEESGWFITQDQIRRALLINEDSGSPVVVLDRTQFQPLFNEIDETLGFEPVDGRLTYDAQRNWVTEFQPPIDGRGLDHHALFDRIIQVAQSGESRVEIPIIGRPAKQSQAGAESPLITTLLAAGESLFIDSADYRIHNIGNGSGLLHGAVVMPGEIFSFNEYLGTISPERGFIDGLVIIEDSTEDAIGGGICQVSTTMFRAAFWAGLPILERHKHLYRVRYYEQGGNLIGFDASIWQPALDLRFMNDTEGPIMVRTLFDRRRQRLRFELWGTPTGRSVEISDHQLRDWEDPPPDEWEITSDEGPDFKEQTEWAVEGVYAVLRRRVMVGDQVHLEDAFYSSFKSWPNRYTVSSDVAEKEAPEAYQEWIAEAKSEVEETEAGVADEVELTGENGSPGETGGMEEEEPSDL